MILSTCTPNGDIHPIVFHSCTFSGAELNYDIHDKELLTIFEVFKCWQHYVEGSGNPIDVVTNHKNLEYFSTTKILTHHQVRWNEYFKEGRSDYATVNPHNFRPIFAQDQLMVSLWAMHVTISHSGTPAVCVYCAAMLDIVKLHDDICATLLCDPAILPLLSIN
jgi:hypothetical protein